MLTIYTSNRLDTLVDRLADETASSPLPPLEREIVVVQSEGMQRWLTLELARRQGIAASLTTPFPRPFCRWLARRVLDDEAVPLSESIPRGDDSSFGREMLSWRLFGLLDDLDSSQTLRESAPAAYLADDGDQRKRYQLAQRLGSLFDDYQMFRPELLDAWQRGEAGEAKDGPGDGPSTEAWQGELWRRLVWSSGDGEQPFSRRLMRLTRRLGTATKEPPGLPGRLWVLGVSTLPPAFVQLLVALARWRPVGILFVSPTYHYWGDLRSEREQAYLQRLQRRLRVPSAEAPEMQHLERGNALLAALGRQGREFFDILQDADPTGAAWHDLDFHDPAAPVSGASEASGASRVTASALATLQSDILHLVDRSDPDGPGPVPWPEDDVETSLEVHACHAPMREMEVLRDRLLDAFVSDPALRPSDVLVLVPDIELYGPYIQAVFGSEPGSEPGGSPQIPFSIADRRTGKEQPPSETILDVLDLVRSRATVREVFDLLDTPAVRRRFGLEPGDLPELRRLAQETRVRWGFDGEHRHRVFDVPLVEQNTWRAGLDRLVLGYAAGGVEELVGAGDAAVLPFAGDTTGAVDVLGRFVRFVETLAAAVDDLRRPRSFDAWADALLEAVDRLFAAESEDEERGLQAIRDAADQLRRLAAVASSATKTEAGGTESAKTKADKTGSDETASGTTASEETAFEETASDEPVHLQVVREHLGTVLSAEGFASGFLAGKVTFCALRPMRTIPFRVIAVAGLDDGAFPRRDRRPGFDLMSRSRRPGDRSVRDDDRYLFLETILAARSRLILSYVGFSQRDATRREPSVVLSELLDQVDRTFVCADGGRARRKVVVEHPLQPWSARYFRDDAAVPRSFDDAQRRAAEALRRGGDEVPAFAPSPLDRGIDGAGDMATEGAAETLELTVDDLVRFWLHPTRAFCRHLGLALDVGGPDDGLEDDAEPFLVDGIEGYAARQWLVERRLRARGAEASREADAPQERQPERQPERQQERALLRARGLLPPGTLGDTAWRELSRRVDEFLRRVPDETRLEPATVDLRGGDPERGTAWRLGGRLDERTARGLLHARCGTLRAVDRLRTWIEHLVFVASAGAAAGGTMVARLVGESDAFHYAAPADAAVVLDRLVDGTVQGLRRPLPFVAEASLAWAEQARALADPRRRVRTPAREAARQVFEGRYRLADAPDPEARDPYVRQCFRDLDLLDHPEAGRWAEAVWGPLFDHEREAS